MQKVYLIPVGRVAEEILEVLRSPVESRFGFPCVVGEGMEHPDYAYSSTRGQYYATRILRELRQSKPKDALKVLGIVDADLYVPQLNFVFGEADQRAGVAVISLYRLRQELYGMEPDERLFKERAIKEAVHELGHTFGLGHCRDPGCVMHFSNSLADTDIKSDELCEFCQQKLKKMQGVSF